MVAIGPRGTAYTAAAFEILADLYYRTIASVNGATGHQALRTLMSGDTPADLRAALFGRVLIALRLGIAPALGYDPLQHDGTGASDISARLAEESGPAGFALVAVWSRLAADPPTPGTLGAAYLAAHVTAQVLRHLRTGGTEIVDGCDTALAPMAAELSAFSAHAERFATHIRHVLLETLSEDPTAAVAILQGFDRLAVIYPLPLLDDAVLDAMDSREVA